MNCIFNKNQELFLFVFSFLILTTSTYSQTTYTSTGNGSWLNAGTWDNGIPGDGTVGNENIVVIDTGDTVFITGDCVPGYNEVVLNDVVIYVYGSLELRDAFCAIFYDPGDIIINGTGSGLRIENGGSVYSDLSCAILCDTIGEIMVNGVQEWNVNDPLASGPQVLGAPANPLPVKLENWKAQIDGDFLRASWTGINESPITEYIIESSDQEVNFEEIHRVQAKRLGEINNYSEIIPLNINSENIYIRLNYNDINGLHYSKILHLENNDFQKQINLYPNPVSDGKLNISQSGFEISELKIYDRLANLKKAYNKNELSISKSEYIIDIPAELQEGVYILQVHHKSGIEKIRFIKR